MNTLQNPILPGFAPDASALHVGEDYYIATSTFEWWPGIEIYHSKDLVNWQWVAAPIARHDMVPSELLGNYNSGSLWAPHLSYADGLFWLVYTDVKSSTAFKDTLNYVVTSPKITGPWSEPTLVTASGFDPALFSADPYAGAKAAASYKTAKRIIELICSLSADVNADPVCKGRLQVFFLENYRVSVAEKLMPAAQESEQISTAGKEASGTGNMKLMLNGAVTIGTLDGANVEMYERLGDKNMFLFGLKTDEVTALKASGYDPQRYAREDAELGAVLDRISRGFADGKSYSDLVSNLLYNGDPYMLCADFRDYVNTHDRMYSVISDPAERARLSIINTAEAGIFAADRAIKEYAEDIWGIKL